MSINYWQGELVRMRAIESGDWQHFFEWNRDTFIEQTTDSIHFPQSQEKVQKWAAEAALAEPNNDAYKWVIDNHAGEFVGTLNTHNCNPRHGTFQYGLAIRREFWRKGYASEAIQIVLRYFFGELRYQKVNVHIYDFNQASLDLHRKLGFREEGRLRRTGYTAGRYYDWILMGLTREEFG
jgi:RimJ/RimL family protein N-acetyltransferase